MICIPEFFYYFLDTILKKEKKTEKYTVCTMVL